MVEPLTLAALGSTTLTEGVKFLYGQLTDLLKRRREHRDDPGSPPDGLSVPATPLGVLDGPLDQRPVNVDVLDANWDKLLELRRGLVDYVDGVADVAPTDMSLVHRLTDLRGLLELIYGQRLSLTGELGRPATGTAITETARDQISQQVSGGVTYGDRAPVVGINTGVVSTGDQAHIR
jgi:hypothetical protein